MADYLDLPYILDVFESHDDRRKLMDRLAPGHLEIYENNALRAGRANAVCLSVELLHGLYLDKEDTSFFELTENIRGFGQSFSPHKYDLLRADEKFVLAHSLKERIHSLFRYLENR